MEALKVRVFIEYQQQVSLIKLKSQLKDEELLLKVLKKLELNIEEWENYSLHVKTPECRVTRAKDLLQNDILILRREDPKMEVGENQIEISSQKETISEDSNDSIRTEFSLDNWLNEDVSEDLGPSVSGENSEESFDSDSSSERTEVEMEVRIEEIKAKEWSDRESLSTELNLWAAKKRMKLSLDSQERKNKDGTKVSKFYCSKKKQKKCGFYLEFRSKDKGYILSNSSNIHNHKLFEYDGSSAITEEIFNKIKVLKPVTIDSGALTKAINDEFKTNFDRRTIYYQMKLAVQQEQGVPNDDANNFIKLLEEDAKNKNGIYETLIENGRLKSCYFMSQRMRDQANYFSDVLIIDTSHKVNRFNLPLLDIVSINNLGKTVTCFVGLLGNQNFQTFLWILENFKKQLKKSPTVIFSDEEEALTKGKIINLMCFI